MKEPIVPYNFEGNEGEVTVTERKLNIPPELKVIGVQNDNNVEQITFRIPKMFDGYNDLSTFDFKVNWTNALGNSDSSAVSIASGGEFITLNWKVPRELCIKEGKVKIAIYAYNSDGRSWNTTFAEAEVLQGIVVNKEIAKKYPDAIADLQKRVLAIENSGGGGTAPDTQTIVNEVIRQLPKWNGGAF